MSEMPDPRPVPDFKGLVEHLVNDGGYGLNSCPGHCPYQDEEHAHLRYPSLTWPDKGHGFIAWADGRVSPHDLTQPAAYVPVPVRNVVGEVLSRVVQDQARLLAATPYSPWAGRWGGDMPRPSSCYRARAGFMVHVKPGCRCG